MKRIVFIGIFIFLCTFIFATDINEYPMELAAKIDVGEKKEEQAQESN